MSGANTGAQTGADKTSTGAKLGDKPQSQPTQDPGNGGTGSYGPGGGGRRSTAGSATPKATQKKTQAQINNLGGNYQQRHDDLEGISKGRNDDLNKNAGKRKNGMVKSANTTLNNLGGRINANNASLKQAQKQNMLNVDWQPNQQKEQSTLAALRNRMGNSAYGSAIQDLAEGLGRVDDMNDVALINAWKQNEEQAYANWFQANEGLVGDYNEAVANIYDDFSRVDSDFADQLSKFKRDYEDQISQLNSQYWSAMSNINPELASKKNLEKAAENKAGTSKTAKAVTEAKALKKAVDAYTPGKAGGGKLAAPTQKTPTKTSAKTPTLANLSAAIPNLNKSATKKTPTKESAIKNLSTAIPSLGKSSGNTTAKKKISTAGLNKYEKKAAKLIDKEASKKKYKGKNLSAVAKAVKSAQKKALVKAEKANRVSHGKGNDKYYLPNVDLRSDSSAFKQTVSFDPQEIFGKKLTLKNSAPVQDPLTKDYIRPDKGRNVLLGGSKGDITSNRGGTGAFYDNLAAFRRV